MRMNKIQVIVLKEWAEVFKNKLVMFTVIFLPLIFTALPLVILYATRDVSAIGSQVEIPDGFRSVCPAYMNSGECFQLYIVRQFLVLFMLMPLMIPVSIAAYSIVGEKTNRSLEPLLAAPITTTQLLIGKNLAAVIPAVAATWFGFLLFVIGVFITTSSQNMIKALLDPMWLAAILVLGPLLSILSVNLAIMVSSRVNDPRVAEQLSAVVIVPVMILFFGQVTGFLILKSSLVIALGIFVILADVVVSWLTVRIFEREHILTRWK